MSINRVNISGNLTRDPELRMTAGGTQVLGFGVAVNDRRRNPQTGEWEDYPNFVDCTLFGNRADAVSRFLHKGMKVAIEGKLRYSTWQAKDGSKRSKIEIIVDEIEFMQAQQQGGYPQSQTAYQQQPAYQPPAYPQPAYQAQPAPQAYQAPQPAYQPQPAPQPYQQPLPMQQPQQAQPQPAPQQAAQAAQQPMAAQQPVQQAQHQQQPAPQAQQPPVADVYDEDIPF